MRLLSRVRLDLATGSFMGVTFLAGCGAALFVPTLSLFLTDAVGVSPLMVGVFYTCNAVMGILVSQLLAKRSDRRGSRRMLIFYCVLIGILACLVFAFSRQYWVLLTLGIFLLSVSATASPQMFALAREYSDSKGERGVMFTAFLRAQFSLAWVVGPPIAFAVSLHYGFAALFTLGVLIYGLSAALVWFGLPEAGRVTAGKVGAADGFRTNADVRWLFFASMAFWTCNSMYLINMPLYVSRELHLDQSLAGWMMGTAAGLEIPVMLVAGHLSSRWGTKPMLLLAGIAGVFFYIGMSTLHAEWQLLALQLGNALFIGILAGLGMVYFQDLLPGQPGLATTLFTNSVRTGAILAGGLAGVIAQWWSYFGVFVVAIGLASLALVLLWRVKPA